jgi:protein O-mannosyl-transferase
MYGILFAAVALILGVGREITRKTQILSAFVFVLFLTLFAGVTALRSNQWRNNASLYISEVEHHPLSYRANYSAGRQYGILLKASPTQKASFYERAQHYFAESARLDPNHSAQALFSVLYLTHTQNMPFDVNLWNELNQRLTNGQDPTLTTTQFRTLLIWQEQNSTHLSSTQVLALFDAALSNPILPNSERAMLFSMLSSYYANTLHQYNDALLLALKAIETAPDEAVFYISMADLYIQLQNYPEARRQLSLARTRDRVGRFHQAIESLERKLTKDKS